MLSMDLLRHFSLPHHATELQNISGGKRKGGGGRRGGKIMTEHIGAEIKQGGIETQGKELV